MSEPAPQKDLVCLVADKNLEQSVSTLLQRHQALGIRRITYDVHVHPEHDPGCLLHSPDFLRPFYRRMSYAVVLFDHEGCGREETPRQELESELEECLAQAGWQGRARAIVIDPELEAWFWSDSPHVDAALGWAGRSPDLRTWLQEHGLLEARRPKPRRPKEAVEKALWVVRKARSAAIYRQLAEEVSFTRCNDPAFAKLQRTLRAWFASRSRRSTNR